MRTRFTLFLYQHIYLLWARLVHGGSCIASGLHSVKQFLMVLIIGKEDYMRANLMIAILAMASINQPAYAGALAAGSTVDGKTLGVVGQWWQWALSYPVDSNPLLDTTGQSASLGDRGSVFFLGGTNSTGTVQRTFAVPAGKFIFFPLINAFLSEEGTEAEMRVAGHFRVDRYGASRKYRRNCDPRSVLAP